MRFFPIFGELVPTSPMGQILKSPNVIEQKMSQKNVTERNVIEPWSQKCIAINHIKNVMAKCEGGGASYFSAIYLFQPFF